MFHRVRFPVLVFALLALLTASSDGFWSPRDTETADYKATITGVLADIDVWRADTGLRKSNRNRLKRAAHQLDKALLRYGDKIYDQEWPEVVKSLNSLAMGTRTLMKSTRKEGAGFSSEIDQTVQALWAVGRQMLVSAYTHASGMTWAKPKESYRAPLLRRIEAVIERCELDASRGEYDRALKRARSGILHLAAYWAI